MFPTKNGHYRSIETIQIVIWCLTYKILIEVKPMASKAPKSLKLSQILPKYIRHHVNNLDTSQIVYNNYGEWKYSQNTLKGKITTTVVTASP